ncbi:MAG: carbon-nitrogen hydrolase [Candidatus Omnitrophica bacterium]|nr:carbon-nitrogen hydrolase [Candidatus Omnitrophota bacterium]
MVQRNKVKIALIQMKAEPSPELNLVKAIQKVKEAAKRGAQIISLQELYRTPYFPQTKNSKNFRLAEPISGITTAVFRQIARKLQVVIITPIFERTSSKRFHNTAVVINADGSMAGVYRKMHLPNDPCFYEKFYFKAGDLGFRVCKTRYGKIGVLICWDQWFPEAARILALQGAQILFYPTAIGWFSKQSKRERHKEHTAWEVIQRAHAIANGVYVASVNRVGREGKLEFWGSSFIAGPFGEIVAKANEAREEIVMATCDLSKIGKVRKNWPFLRERSTDAYQGLTRRYSQ